MRYRSPARWLAPLALLGSVAAIMVVVSSSGGTSESTPSPGITGSTAAQDDGGSADSTTTTATSPSDRRFYRVKDGDTLTLIADRTGVALEEIELLNPKIDAQTLRAGQRIKLRP